MKPKVQTSLLIALCAVLALPLLVPINYMPVASVFNDVMSLLLWGSLVVAFYTTLSGRLLGVNGRPARERITGPAAGTQKPNSFQALTSPSGAPWVLGAIAFVFALQIGLGNYGFISQVVSAMAMAAAAWIVFNLGAVVCKRLPSKLLALSFATALTVTGLLACMIGWVQYFYPAVDSIWINPLMSAGRVYGNVRQPNHFALALFWAVWGTVWSIGASQSKTVCKYAALVLIVPVFVMTSSRMATTFILALFPLAFAAQNPGRTLKAAAAALMIFALSWGVANSLVGFGLPFYGAERLEGGLSTGGRLGLWSDILKILPQLPFNGCGVGQFGPCFIHSDLTVRQSGVFENGHNFLLNSLVEWGWPLTALLMIWLLSGVSAFFKNGLRTTAVLPAGIFLSSLTHAMLEYPWWYAYLLLPTAFCFGWMWTSSLPENSERLVFDQSDAKEARRSYCGKWGGVLLVGFAIVYAIQYYPLRVMFSTQFFQKTAPVNLQKISSRSPLFSAPLSYSMVIALSENLKREDAKQLLPFFKLAGRSTIAPEFMARFAVAAALADEQNMAKHLAWRVYIFDKARAVVLTEQIRKANDRTLDWFLAYLESPTAVNLDRTRFANN